MTTHIIIGGSTQATRLALNALPRIFLNGNDHVWCELETAWVTWNRQKTNLTIDSTLTNIHT